VRAKVLPTGEPPGKRFILCVDLKHWVPRFGHPPVLVANRGTQSLFPDSPPQSSSNLNLCRPVVEIPAFAKGRKQHASNIDGASFGRCSDSRLLSKCRRGSGQRSSYEACRNRRFNSARRAVLRTSHPSRRCQVLPAIRRGAPRLPPLLSLVVIVCAALLRRHSPTLLFDCPKARAGICTSGMGFGGHFARQQS
jgi:hypothetical protein